MEQKIVCAANLFADDDGAKFTILGVRHWDALMKHILGVFPDDLQEIEQGFIDNQGTFLSRTEAWKVAEAAGQIIRRVGGDDANGGTLYSENLY